MGTDNRVFNSRLARRLFLLFLACVGLPLAVMSALTLISVRQSREQEQARRSQDAAKDVGLALYRGLLQRVDALSVLAASSCARDRHESPPAYWTDRFGAAFDSVWLVQEDGGTVHLLGAEEESRPALSPPALEDRPRLIATGGEESRLALAGSEGCRDGRAVSYVAYLAPESLFEPAEGLGVGPDAALRVLDAGGSVLFDSTPVGEGPLGDSHRAGAAFRGEAAGEPGRWTLFLGGRLEAQNWEIEVRSPRAASHPLAGYEVANLLLVTLLGLATAILASIVQIRRSLVPLDKLTEATRALARGAFTRVGIDCDDEFGLLADSFEEMAAQIRRQFDQLSETADQLRRARDEALSASRAKSDFLAMMSHEIRTPMNGILGMAELALEGGDVAEQRESLSIIRQSASSLQRVLSDVLDYAKMEAGRLEVELTDVSIADLVQGTSQVFRADLTRRDIALHVDVSPELAPLIRTDAARVRQILLNLLGNAAKFVERGRVDVVVRRVEQQLDSGPKLEICVADTGPGIAPDLLQQIFEPFAQGEDYLRRTHGGTGLGLATCRKLATLLGGSIEVESTPGEGSQFRVVLPLLLAEAVDGPDEAEFTGEMEHRPPIKGLAVLVAEDNPVNQRVVERMLCREGCRVTVAANGKQAVDAVRHGEFDAILMDIQMPVMDGLAATAALRARGCSLPIIALTAHALPSDHERFLSEGIDRVLTKPIARERLLEALRTLDRVPVGS